MSSPSTTQDYINAFKLIEKNPKDFLEAYVAEDVNWTVTEPSGKSTSIAGIYKSRADFMQGALAPLGQQFAVPLKLKVGESLFHLVYHMIGQADLTIEFILVDVIVGEKQSNGMQKICMELEGTAVLKRNNEDWSN